MANQGQINVVITDNTTSGASTSVPGSSNPISPGGGGQVVVPSTPSTPQESPNRPYTPTSNVINLNPAIESEAARISVSSTAAIAYLVQNVKQAGSMALSNVGKYSGSNQTQTSVNNLLQGAGLMFALYKSPIAALTASAFSITQTILDERFRRKEESLQLSITRSRNGYSDAKSILTSRRH